MKLFFPSTRAIIWLLLIGFASLGYALYLRYFIIEQSSVGLACDGGLNSWLCSIRKIAISLFKNSVFGIAALAIAMLHFLRPTPLLFALALAAAGFGIVLYNVSLSALAVGILVLSLARREPEPE